jgi:hypothetical protein
VKERERIFRKKVVEDKGMKKLRNAGIKVNRKG